MKKYLMRISCFLLSFCILISVSVSAFAENTGSESENGGTKAGDGYYDFNTGLQVEVKAKAAILVDVNSGTVLAELNADERLFPASVTKIMTILLCVEAIEEGRISLTDEITCSETAASKGGSEIWLEQGEIMTVDELLRATVIGSANDAACALGEYISGSEEAFVKLMNARAAELDMTNTVFENATGLDDTATDHKTTARDIAKMSIELLKHEMIKNYSTVWMDSLRDGKTELVNTNKLVRFYSGTTGLKTGTTDKAGCCISASAERDGLHLVAVVLGSDTSNDRFQGAKALLSWGFSNFSSVKVTPDLSLLAPVKVFGGEKTSFTPSVSEEALILVKKGDEEKLSQKAELSLDVQAPVLKGQTVGKISVEIDGEKLFTFDVFSNEEIKELTFFTALKRLSLFLLSGACDYS